MRWILIHLNSEFHAVYVKSATSCDGNNILFSYFFHHAYRKVHYHGLTQSKLLLLFYQIISTFQRKQSSRFWILEAQNNILNGTHAELRLCGFSNYAKIRVSRQIHLHRVTTIWFVFSSENLHALDFNTL